MIAITEIFATFLFLCVNIFEMNNLSEYLPSTLSRFRIYNAKAKISDDSICS